MLDRGEIDRQIELYRTRTADERREIVGLQPKRAEVILAGACIVRTVLDTLHCDELTVSDRGLRHGLLVEQIQCRTSALSRTTKSPIPTLTATATDTPPSPSRSIRA